MAHTYKALLTFFTCSFFIIIRTEATDKLGDRLVAGIWKQDPLPLTEADAIALNWTKVESSSNAYTRIPGKDVVGHTINVQPVQGNIETLQATCDATQGCVAFNSFGWLKNSVSDLEDSIVDLYVKSSAAGCDETFGFRYRLGDRLTPTLIYDNSGTLAGYQMVIDSDTFPLYPESNLRAPSPFISMQDWDEPASHYALTLHFLDPQYICSAELREYRTTAELGAVQDEGEVSIGDRLWLRRGTDSNAQIDFEVLPLTELALQNAQPNNGWVAGACAPTGFAYDGSPGMGLHYWQYLDKDLPCQDAGPIFLLYDKGLLTAFGFTFVGMNGQVPTVNGERPVKVNGRWVMPGTSLWEFAQQPLNGFFFTDEQNPTCLQNLNTWDPSLPYGNITTGTLHVFVSDPFAITCTSGPSPSSNCGDDDDDDDDDALTYGLGVVAFVFLLIIVSCGCYIFRLKRRLNVEGPLDRFSQHLLLN